jgi:hypothetical protein
MKLTSTPPRGAARLVLAALAVAATVLATASAARAAVSRTSFTARAAAAPSRTPAPASSAVLHFEVRGLAGRVRKAVLVLDGGRPPRSPVRVRRMGSRRAAGAVIGSWRPARGSSRRRSAEVDVTRAVGGNGVVRLVVTTADRRALLMLRRSPARTAALRVQLVGGAPSTSASRAEQRSGASASGRAGTSSSSKAASAKPSAPAANSNPTASAPAPTPASRAAGPGLWVTPAEVTARPAGGPAWDALKRTADAAPGSASIADQESDHDVNTLAAALVYARTGIAAYGEKARAGIAAAIGTEAGGRTLALGRNLPSYVIAADLIGLGAWDAGLDARFRAWLSGVRTKDLGGDTLISTHELRPNNWGTMAGAARIAAAAYLGDTVDLQRAATVFRGWLGDRAAYAGFKYGDLSYQADPSRPVGVNPAGAVKEGVSIDGALPDDMRRGCPFAPNPCFTDYAWEALQGAIVQAELLRRRGFDAWRWSDNALLRAARYLHGLDARYGGWWATGDDTWQPWLLNHAYGTSLPVQAARSGKIMGFTDWTHAG